MSIVFPRNNQTSYLGKIRFTLVDENEQPIDADLSLSNDSKEGRWALGKYLEKFQRTPKDQVRRRGVTCSPEKSSV